MRIVQSLSFPIFTVDVGFPWEAFHSEQAHDARSRYLLSIFVLSGLSLEMNPHLPQVAVEASVSPLYALLLVKAFSVELGTETPGETHIKYIVLPPLLPEATLCLAVPV